jgi:glycosyltransferase involved in cell wall biosynthesis
LDKWRIAVVCPYYPWPPSIGGVENIVRTVSTELAQRGHEVHVVSSCLGVTPVKKASDLGVEEKEGVTIHKLRPSRLRVGYARFLEGLKEVVNEIKPDIVHSHNLHPHLFQLIRWKIELGYELVAELHHPALTVDRIGANLLFPIVTWRLGSKCNEIDAFIAHAKSEKEWLVEKGVKDDQVQELFFPAIPSKLLDYRSNIIGDDLVLFIGRIIRTKGLHVLLEAMSRVIPKAKDASLVLAGPKDAGYFRFLKNRALSLGLEKNVIFLDPVFGEEKYDIIRKSSIFVLPSLKEYTPSVLIEAQALGVPVVATRVGAVPEMMADGDTGRLVEPGSSVELAEAVGTLLLNEDERIHMGARAKEFSRNFTLENAVGKLEVLYHKLIGKAKYNSW